MRIPGGFGWTSLDYGDDSPADVAHGHGDAFLYRARERHASRERPDPTGRGEALSRE